MEIKKQCIKSGKTVFDSQIKTVCDGSIIVPDVKPDIDKVLEVDAETFLCDKTVEDGKVTLSGRVNVTVLYTPEGEGFAVCAIHGCFEFCEVIKRAEFVEGMQVVALCDADKVTYKLLNSRKIGIEAQVTMNVEAYAEDSLEYICDVEDDSAQCQYDTMHLCSADLFKEYRFAIDEKLLMPGTKPQIEEILKGNVVITDKEYKALADRVIIKGRVLLNLLYLTTNNEIDHLTLEQPFTEVVDMPGIAENTDCDICYEAGELKLKKEESADEQCVNMMLDITVIVRTEKEESVSALCDLYFTDSMEELGFDEISLEETTSHLNFQTIIKEMITKKENMPDVFGVYSAVAKPYIETVKAQKDKILVGGRLVVYVLYTTENEQVPICSMSEEIPFNYAIECNGDCDESDILLKGECEHISAVICSKDTVELRCGIRVSGRSVKKKKMRMISDIARGERIAREPGIIVYFTKKDDSVWDIAKKYRVKKECIINAVNSCEDFDDGMKIIIPITK